MSIAASDAKKGALACKELVDVPSDEDVKHRRSSPRASTPVDVLAIALKETPDTKLDRLRMCCILSSQEWPDVDDLGGWRRFFCLFGQYPPLPCLVTS